MAFSLLATNTVGVDAHIDPLVRNWRADVGIRPYNIRKPSFMPVMDLCKLSASSRGLVEDSKSP